jgi:hypothetical protein
MYAGILSWMPGKELYSGIPYLPYFPFSVSSSTSANNDTYVPASGPAKQPTGSGFLSWIYFPHLISSSALTATAAGVTASVATPTVVATSLSLAGFSSTGIAYVFSLLSERFDLADPFFLN